MRRALHNASAPAHFLAKGLHWLFPHNRMGARILVGIMFILIGSFIATHIEIAAIPRMYVDAVAYFLHGMGSAPIISALIGE